MTLETCQNKNTKRTTGFIQIHKERNLGKLDNTEENSQSASKLKDNKGKSGKQKPTRREGKGCNISTKPIITPKTPGDNNPDSTKYRTPQVQNHQ